DGKEAAVGVRPELHMGEGRDGLARFLNIGKLLENAAVGQQDPPREENFILGFRLALDEYGVFAESFRGGGYYGFQKKMPVRNVHCQNSVGLEMAEIQFECLERQEVDRNGIA